MSTTNTLNSNIFNTLKKRTIAITLTQEELGLLLTNSGGQIKLATAPYQELNDFDNIYWAFHNPWGLPGDELVVQEEYRIAKVCQTLDGYSVTVQYRDDTTRVFDSKITMALTPKGSWIQSKDMPDFLVRCRLLIQQVTMTDNSWFFTVVTL